MEKREIKFRAWHKEEDKMYLNLQTGFNSHAIGGQYLEECFTDSDLELMQYTGLKDASGKEIYEGDIVEFNQCRDERGYVWISLYNDFRVWAGVMEFQDGRFHIAKSIYLRKASAKITMGNADKKKIIGNIYENPELLKTAKG